MKHLEFGFKNYDELIFGNKQTDLEPFTNENWNLINSWYWTIAGIIGGPILIAIIILAWKMIVAGISPDKRNDVKDSLMRLFFRSISYSSSTYICEVYANVKQQSSYNVSIECSWKFR